MVKVETVKKRIGNVRGYESGSNISNIIITIIIIISIFSSAHHCHIIEIIVGFIQSSYRTTVRNGRKHTHRVRLVRWEDGKDRRENNNNLNDRIMKYLLTQCCLSLNGEKFRLSGDNDSMGVLQ